MKAHPISMGELAELGAASRLSSRARLEARQARGTRTEWLRCRLYAKEAWDLERAAVATGESISDFVRSAIRLRRELLGDL